jgi:peptidoglycan/xylan/chitin deacetylase (PgdA/CDA1 family)
MVTVIINCVGKSMPALILMYHDLAESIVAVAPGHRPYVLAPAVFRRQMKLVAESMLHSVTVSEWCTVPALRFSVAITFDDGHISNCDIALPILLESGLKATFFITAGRIGKDGTMTWAQIRRLHDAGMEIGSHTLTHRPPSTLTDPELRYELVESRRVLEDGLGSAVTSISSPTGFFNPRMSAMAHEVGYRALCIGRVGLALDGSDPFSLNRVAVKRGWNERRFQALLAFDRLTLASLRARQRLRELVRECMSIESYLRMRRLLLRTGSP